jgi:hypothetical protein
MVVARGFELRALRPRQTNQSYVIGPLRSLLKNSARTPQSPSAAEAATENKAVIARGGPLRHPKSNSNSSFSAIC